MSPGLMRAAPSVIGLLNLFPIVGNASFEEILSANGILDLKCGMNGSGIRGSGGGREVVGPLCELVKESCFNVWVCSFGIHPCSKMIKTAHVNGLGAIGGASPYMLSIFHSWAMRISVSILFAPSKHPLANTAHAFHVFHDPDTSADLESAHGISAGIPADVEAVSRGETFIGVPVGFNLIFIYGLK